MADHVGRRIAIPRKSEEKNVMLIKASTLSIELKMIENLLQNLDGRK